MTPIDPADSLNKFGPRMSGNPLDYVLENLYQSRQQAIEHPEWFEPDSLERIDRAILDVRKVKETEAA
jgi:hypothetical protein